MPEYLEEMAHICQQLNICDEDDLNVIALSLNPELDIIDQLCGEIYVAFRDKLDAKAAAPYIIQASPYDPDKSYMMPYLDMGEPKKLYLIVRLSIAIVSLTLNPCSYICVLL